MKKQSLKESYGILKANAYDICFISFQTSILGIFCGAKRLFLFIDAKEDNSDGLLMAQLKKIESLLSGLFQLREIYTDDILAKLALQKLQNETNEPGEIENRSRMYDFAKSLTSPAKTGENVLLYILNFKGLAYRIPMILAGFSFFKFLGVESLIKISGYFSYVQKPLKFFEMVTNKPSLASMIGLTFYLVLVFYILMIPTAYFANKYYEDKVKYIAELKAAVDETTKSNAVETSTGMKDKSNFFLKTGQNWVNTFIQTLYDQNPDDKLKVSSKR
jgi:hypothetical protein